MKILFISDSFPPYGFGAQTSTYLIVKSLAKKNTCEVLTYKFKDIVSKKSKIKVNPLLTKTAISKFSFNNGLKYLWNTLFFLPLNFFLTRNFIKKIDPDVISITFTSFHFIPIILGALSTKKPISLDIRGGSINCPVRTSEYLFSNGKYCNKNCFFCMNHRNFTNNSFIFKMLRPILISYDLMLFKFWNFLFKMNLKKVDSFVECSNFVANKLVLDRVDKRKVCTIYNISQKNKNYTIKRRNKIIFAGRLERNKGIWDAIEAFELIKQENIIFEIAGDGDEFQKIKEYLKIKKIKNIVLLGKISNKEVLKKYADSKIILGPSIVPEAFGRFIQEGVSTKTPVIASRVGGIPEGIKNRKTGILVEPNNPKQLAKAIKELLSDKKLYNHLVKNLAKEQKKYSSQKIGKQRLALYKRLIEENKKEN